MLGCSLLTCRHWTGSSAFFAVCMCLNDDFSRQFYQLAQSVHIRLLHNTVENKDEKTVLWILRYFQGCF